MKEDKNEERERSKMRKRMQEDMYGDSLRILKDLELDLQNKKKLSQQRERELEIRERYIMLEEEKWKRQEREMEIAFRERLQKELAAELAHGVSTSTPKKVMTVKLIEQEESSEKAISERRRPECNVEQERIGSVRIGNDDSKKVELKSNIADLVANNKSRENPEGSGNSEKGDKGNQSTDSGFIMKPFLCTFSGTDPRPKNESSFDDWRVEVESLIASKHYSDFAISQAIRKSLKVPAKRVLLAMSITASSRYIISRLENVYGNVACGQAVVQEFYTAEQSAEENVAEWAVRLEEILKRAVDKGQVKEDSRDEILRSKFWRGLYSQDLKNATKIYYESEKCFEKLLFKVRSEEYELNKPKADDKKKNTGAKAQHHPMQGLPEKQMEILKTLCDRMDAMEKSVQYNSYRGRGRRGRGRGRSRGNWFSKDNQNSGDQKPEPERKQTVPKQPAGGKKNSKND